MLKQNIYIKVFMKRAFYDYEWENLALKIIQSSIFWKEEYACQFTTLIRNNPQLHESLKLMINQEIKSCNQKGI